MNDSVSWGAQAPGLTDEQKVYLISAWQRADASAKAAIEYERNLRTQVFATCFDTNKREGTEHFELPEGWDLQALKKQAYKIDSARINTVLDAVEALGDRAKLRSEELVKFKPELSVSTYKKLAESTDEIDKKIYSLILPVVTIEPAMGSLKLNPPKLAK